MTVCSSKSAAKPTLRTTCAQSGQVLEMVVDSDLQVELLTQAAKPVVSLPLIDFKKLGLEFIYDAL